MMSDNSRINAYGLLNLPGSTVARLAGVTPRTLVTFVVLVVMMLSLQEPRCLAQVQKEFSDIFVRAEVKGGKKCTDRLTLVCLPKQCRIDFSRTASTNTGFFGGYGQGGPGYGVFVGTMNNHRADGFATYTLDTTSQCLLTMVRVCAKNNQRGWYEGRHVIFAKCYPKCNCDPGSVYDINRDGCVTKACDSLPGIPDGDKGGGYFASQNALFKDAACSDNPCQNLSLTLDTGTAAWNVTRPGGAQIPAVLVAPTNPGWVTAGNGRWVSADSDSGHASGDSAGNYTYETTFCLCPGYQEASLDLRLWGDNTIMSVTLNGKEIGGAPTNIEAFKGNGLPVSTTTYNNFVPGQNRLQIVVNNRESATGLRVAGTVTAPGGQCP